MEPQQNLAPIHVLDRQSDSRKKVQEQLLHTAQEVMFNIGRILKGEPTEANAQQQIFPHFDRSLQLTNTETVQNFAISLNELDESAIDKDGSDDDIIWLDTSTGQTEAPLPSTSSADNRSSSSLSISNYFVPASPSFTQLSTGPMTALDVNRQKKAGLNLWSDHIIIALLNQYVEWSIKYPNRYGGIKLLAKSINNRACEIGADFKINSDSLYDRTARLRKKMRQKQQQEMLAAQMREENANTLPSPEQQHMPTLWPMDFTDGQNLATNENNDEDDIEILSYKDSGTASTVDYNANAFPEIGEGQQQNNNIAPSNESVAEVNNIPEIEKDAFAQLEGEIGEEMEAETMDTNEGDVDTDAAQETENGPAAAVQLAKRSKPFSRRIANNIGWRKRFVRVPSKWRDTFGLVVRSTEDKICYNQQLLDSLKDSNPSMFLRNDEYVSKCSDGIKAMNGNKSLYQINEFDEVYKRWISKTEQEEKKSSGKEKEQEEEVSEEEESDDDNEAGRIFRGPVIKCPRMPKLETRLKRVTSRTIARALQRL